MNLAEHPTVRRFHESQAGRYERFTRDTAHRVIGHYVV